MDSARTSDGTPTAVLAPPPQTAVRDPAWPHREGGAERSVRNEAIGAEKMSLPRNGERVRHNYLRLAVEMLGIRVAPLAKVLNVSEASLYSYRSGRRRPRLETRMALADLLDERAAKEQGRISDMQELASSLRNGAGAASP